MDQPNKRNEGAPLVSRSADPGVAYSKNVSASRSTHVRLNLREV